MRVFKSLILAGALTSIAINPLMFKAVAPLLQAIRARSALARALERRSDPLAELPMSTHEKFLSGQVVLVGYGRVGRRIAQTLAERAIPYVVAEQNRELVERLRREGMAAVCGDASDPAVLIQAHIARASMLVVATSSTFNVRQIHNTARLLNPSIETVVRTHSEEEAELLEQEQIGTIFFGEGELAKALYIEDCLRACGVSDIRRLDAADPRIADMAPLCDVLLRVPSAETAEIQQGHAVLGHILCGLVEQAVFGTSA